MKKLTLLLALFFSLQMIYAQNYDESKVGNYQLPELLKTRSGKTVSTPEQWENIRRPEILKLFEDHVYGQVPRDFDDIKFKVTNQDKKAMDGKATLKEVAITVTRNNKSVTMNLLMFTPNNVKKPAPMFLVINHRGLKTMDVTRQNKDGFWPAEEVIEAGYGISGFDVIDVSPDDKVKFKKGILEQLYPEQLEMDNGMRGLGAWGWGASRAIDYFEKDKSVDATKIISVGHSRGGKSSLWFGAQDQRVAITISNESGNSGAALSRRNFGETVERITTSFPYWFCPNYQKYAGNEDNLPVDQHMLIALMAPRAVYVASAAEDLWADPKGQYLALKEAQPAFGLYGIETNLPAEMPEVNEQIIRPHMGFHNREGKHNMTPYDWQQFIQFANVYFKNGNKETLWEQIEPFFSPPREFKNNYGDFRSPLDFYNGKTVNSAEDWNLRREEILDRWHEMMGEWPDLITGRKLEIIETTKRENFTQHKVRFYWLPNEQTEGYLLIPDKAGKKPAAITVYYEPETAIGLGKPFRDFAYQLAKRGFVTLSIGTTKATEAKTYSLYYPNIENAQVQPLSMLGYAAANAWNVLAKVEGVDSTRIGIVGHSFGGKWAMFASCLYEKFACAVWSDPGIVFDETKGSAVNYWEPWYLGYYPPPWSDTWRKTGLTENAKGLYPKLVKEGHDLHELHALMAPRPFLVSGGSSDPPERWKALNHTIAVNKLLGFNNRVAMTNRPEHSPNKESNEQIYRFFEYFLKK